MRFSIIGVRNTSFKTDTGDFISGQTIWFTEPVPPQKGKGFKADRAFLPERKAISPDMLPCECEIYFNRFGKVESVTLL